MCNGLVEKFNGTLKTMLRRLCNGQPKQWLNQLLLAYREVSQELTGFAPFVLLYGRTVRGPMRILRSLWTEEKAESEVRNSYQYLIDLRDRLEETLKIAQEEAGKAQTRHKHCYDRSTRRPRFKVGDTVLILLPTRTPIDC